MRARWLALTPILAACDSSTGPSDGWTYEGTIESAYQLVADVDQYATITCQIDGRGVTVYTGAGGGDNPHCLKLYHTEQVGGTIVPTHTLYVVNGPFGARYRARVE